MCHARSARRRASTSSLGGTRLIACHRRPGAPSSGSSEEGCITACTAGCNSMTAGSKRRILKLLSRRVVKFCRLRTPGWSCPDSSRPCWFSFALRSSRESYCAHAIFRYVGIAGHPRSGGPHRNVSWIRSARLYFFGRTVVKAAWSGFTVFAHHRHWAMNPGRF
jgi:hypothetical protein